MGRGSGDGTGGATTRREGFGGGGSCSSSEEVYIGDFRRGLDDPLL